MNPNNPLDTYVTSGVSGLHGCKGGQEGDVWEVSIDGLTYDHFEDESEARKNSETTREGGEDYRGR